MDAPGFPGSLRRASSRGRSRASAERRDFRALRLPARRGGSAAGDAARGDQGWQRGPTTVVWRAARPYSFNRHSGTLWTVARRVHPTETFTLAPEAELDPHARIEAPIRARLPWLEPPPGLRVRDLSAEPGNGDPAVRPALLAEPYADPVVEGAVRCVACAHRCVVRPARLGICGVRQNRGGRLFTLVYGETVALGAEPIEKKPFYHVRPGSLALSVATRGCNFHCAFCQNWEIAQAHREGIRPMTRQTTPAEVVERALAAGAESIAYTYVEPTVFVEFALDTMRLAREAGLLNLFVSNGYQTPEALAVLAPWLDAANVDLKAFSDATYRRICGARLEPVLAALEEMRRLGVWLEVTTLVIPGVNDSPEELRSIAEWLADRLGPEAPWHVSRFYGAHRMLETPSTPAATLELAAGAGRGAGLRHVYVGNAPELADEDTRCAGCGRTLVRRHAFEVVGCELVEGRCPSCGRRLAGLGLDAPTVSGAAPSTPSSPAG